MQGYLFVSNPEQCAIFAAEHARAFKGEEAELEAQQSFKGGVAPTAAAGAGQCRLCGSTGLCGSSGLGLPEKSPAQISPRDGVLPTAQGGEGECPLVGKPWSGKCLEATPLEKVDGVLAASVGDCSAQDTETASDAPWTLLVSGADGSCGSLVGADGSEVGLAVADVRKRNLDARICFLSSEIQRIASDMVDSRGDQVPLLAEYERLCNQFRLLTDFAFDVGTSSYFPVLLQS
mmetsp:Transcript_105354/g.186586  ORF Transcript_105354/g.186586 Transcript_105354/m.186586 type:complete len:233 (-) Transcript_105354:141-839(-)